MAYRDVSESLRAYRARIVGDLEEARRAVREAADGASRVRVLERELAETEGLLAKMGGKRPSLPLLDGLSIAAPCKASWERMVGDEHVRFCRQCEKNVYDLSSLSRDEAEALLVAREGQMCVRLFKREDGTVLTSDCPVGVKKRRRRRAALAALGGGLMATAAALATESSTPRVTMGAAPVIREAGAPVTMGVVAVPATTGATPTMGVPVPSTGTASPRGGPWTGDTVVLPSQRPVPHPFMGEPAMGRMVPSR